MNKLDLIKLLLDDEQAQAHKAEDKGTFLRVGGQYLFRTVTFIYSGRIKELRGDEILLEDAAWIAETSRWADCVRDAEFNEVEPYAKDVVIFRGGLMDVTEIPKLPREQK